MDKGIVCCICATRQWYIYLATELYALFKNNNIKKLYLFIEDDEIEFLKDKRIEFININKIPEYITKESPNYNTQYSKLSFIRCYFSKILNEDKILYIDADAIVVDNIEELWNIDLKSNLLAGVKEGGDWSEHLGIEGMDDKYINSGVLLMNLDLIRKEQADDKMINLLNENYYLYPDQDVINIVCKDKIKYINNIYNSTETTGIVDNAKIIHYIRQRKGWIKESPRSEIWYNYHKEMIGGNKMDNYKVKAKINFDDVEKGEKRIAGKSEWYCNKERYLYLKEHNAVELIEIEKVDLPKNLKNEENIIPLDEEALKTVAETVNKAISKKETKPKKSKTSKKSKNIV